MRLRPPKRTMSAYSCYSRSVYVKASYFNIVLKKFEIAWEISLVNVISLKR